MVTIAIAIVTERDINNLLDISLKNNKQRFIILVSNIKCNLVFDMPSAKGAQLDIFADDSLKVP